MGKEGQFDSWSAVFKRLQFQARYRRSGQVRFRLRLGWSTRKAVWALRRAPSELDGSHWLISTRSTTSDLVGSSQYTYGHAFSKKNNLVSLSPSNVHIVSSSLPPIELVHHLSSLFFACSSLRRLTAPALSAFFNWRADRPQFIPPWAPQ